MDLSDPSVLVIGSAISILGTGCFVYGKKAGNPKCLLIGLVMAVAPCFLGSVWADIGLAAMCGLGLIVLPSGSA